MKILLVGTGNMATHYASALSVLNLPFDVVGHSTAGKERFTAHTAKLVFKSSLAEYLQNNEVSHAIVATSVPTLSKVTRLLVDWHVPKILVEKPVTTISADLEELSRQAELQGTELFVALNRRFFNSVQMARAKIADTPGPVHLNFRFDDRVSSIPFDKHSPEVLSKWVIANSIHVIDSAFFICGWPDDVAAAVHGKLVWHPTAKQFSGNGFLPRDAGTFGYRADWGKEGNWFIEISTQERVLRLSPLEELFEKTVGQSEWVKKTPLMSLEVSKPGLVPMLSDFLGTTVTVRFSLDRSAPGSSRFSASSASSTSTADAVFSARRAFNSSRLSSASSSSVLRGAS